MNLRIGKERVQLDDADLLGAGGEARVYRWRDRAVKIYHADATRKLAKIARFPSGLPVEVIAPLELAHDPKGKPVGFTMRRVDGAEDFLRLSQRGFRQGVIGNAQVTELFLRLRKLVEGVHDKDVVIGDFNDGNVLFSGHEVFLIDADSMQFESFLCEVGHERFLDPRLYGIDLTKARSFTRETDWYAFAVLLFNSLLYVHPYGGLHKTLPTLLRRAEARHSILRSDVAVPRAAVHWRILPDELLGEFEKIFDKDQRFPLRSLDLHWSRCKCGLEHARSLCPACASLGVVSARTALKISGKCTARTIVQGSIVCAAVQGGIQYLVDDDGALRRENGAVVMRQPRRAGMRFQIAGTATWIGFGKELVCVDQERIAQRAATGTLGNQPMFAASPLGLHRLEGDWLMENDTRVGSILGGQTWLAAGARLGVGFYRAGLVTMWFLFRRGKPGITRIDLPPIEGKLIDVSCVFDDHHALAGVATEKDGLRTHSLYWIDESGKVRARASGSPDSRMLASIHGKAIDGGRLACLTDEGLLSLAIDEATQSISEGRLFTDTAPFCSADAQLLKGPSGSVYVVSPTDIVQLTLTGG